MCLAAHKNAFLIAKPPHCHLTYSKHVLTHSHIMHHWIWRLYFWFSQHFSIKYTILEKPESQNSKFAPSQPSQLGRDTIRQTIWGREEGFGDIKHEILIKFFLKKFFHHSWDLNQCLHSPNRPLNSTSYPSATLLQCQTTSSCQIFTRSFNTAEMHFIFWGG